MMEPDWQRLFGSSGYRFSMGLRSGRLREFFLDGKADEDVLMERARWLAEDLPRYCQLADEGLPLLEEIERLCREWGLPISPASATPVGRLAHLGGVWEPDFLLLKRNGRSRLVAGVVCFPSSWSLEEKMGRAIDEIHDVVPGLNAELGPQIERFLDKLAPGSCFERENWGLSADAELNRHPARELPTLTSETNLQATWLRVEHQILHGMAQNGILFGIRLSVHRLDMVAADPARAQALHRALKTMPDAVASYKGLTQCRDNLLRLLEVRSSGCAGGQRV